MQFFRFKSLKKDFFVQEVLKRDLKWSWDYIYILFQKSWKTTFEVVDFISSKFWINKNNIWLAWLKDKEWITIQWFSLPLDSFREKNPIIFLKKELSSIWKILYFWFDDKALSIKDNLWNNFKILLEKTQNLNKFSSNDELITKALDNIKVNWFPNYYWKQRFWKDNYRWQVWKDILLWKNKKKMSKREEKFKVQAFSSYLFNSYLKLREHRRIWNKSIQWDLILDWIATWPVYAYDLKFASWKALELESKILNDNWLKSSDLNLFKKFNLYWFRRKLYIIPENFSYSFDNYWNLRLKFFLPTWVYASSLYSHLENLLISYLKKKRH